MKLQIKNNLLPLFKDLLRKQWLLIYSLFFVTAFIRQGFIPDWCKLSNVSSKKDFELRMLTSVTGFAGLLLTVLLVAYNFYIKSIRRNTLDYIIQNKWLKISFTLFFCNIFFLGSGYLLLETHIVNDVSYLYFSFISTFTFIASLFPLAILTLSDSSALTRIEELVNTITEENIETLVQPELDPNKDGKVEIEHTPLMVLRDIAVTAVAERDWVLPQTIMRMVANHLIFKINAELKEDKVYIILNAWVAFCNPLKREIVKQEDEPTANVLFYLNVAVYKHLASKKNISLREMPLDNFFKDFIRRVIRKGLFADMQGYIPVNLAEIIRLHFVSLSYSDQELPTMGYIFKHRKEYEENTSQTEIRANWFYLTRDLPDLLYGVLKEFADAGDGRMVDLCFSNFHHTFESIAKTQNLTVDQKMEALQEMIMRARSVVQYCIGKGIVDGIEPVETAYINGWFKVDRNLGYEAFYSYADMIRSLFHAGMLSSHYVDQYFMIVRSAYLNPLEPSILYELTSSLLDTTFYVLDKPDTKFQTRKDFLYELQWLKKEYLSKYVSAEKINEEYGMRIEDVLREFDGRNEYFQGYHHVAKKD
jgi:hypothetical protein